MVAFLALENILLLSSQISTCFCAKDVLLCQLPVTQQESCPSNAITRGASCQQAGTGASSPCAFLRSVTGQGVEPGLRSSLPGSSSPKL